MLLQNIFSSLVIGSLETLKVFAITLIVSFPLALLLASIQHKRYPVIKEIIEAFIYIERGTPLLLQLMFVFFGLPYLGLTLSRTASIYVAFVLNYVAYFTEILRGGIQSVDKAQFEVCKVLGFKSFYTFSRIILPQALVKCIPSIGNEVLALVKDTSLITILGASELLKAGRSAVNTYATAVPFLYVGVIYLIMTAVVTLILKAIEKKVQYE